MTKRIFRSICLAAISVFLISALLFLGILYNYFSDAQRAQLKVQTNLAAQGVIHEGKAYFDGLDTSTYRLTWINADGTVLYDSASNTQQMENHMAREEVKGALAEGVGQSTRYSHTLLERFLYCAQRLPDGTIIRLSVAQKSMLTLFLGMIWPICLLFAFAIVLSLFLASRLSKNIVKPLNELNLDAPLSNDGYDELSPLLRRLSAQQKQIQQQRDELLQKQREFEAVTTGMTEGIILLNQKHQILSINTAAKRLLGADASCMGQLILSVNHSAELLFLLSKADKGTYAEKILNLNGRKYQATASPIVLEGQVSGMALLIFDVTEKEEAEQMRREFTANVSHELKTPLHTISGCAELMSNGMVKDEDMEKFSAQIYTEAQRMIRLVEDILKLSRLDEEKEEGKREIVDIFSMAKETVEHMQPLAKAADITLTAEGESAKLCGISQLLQGILDNLCDNALKYNHPGGSVTVKVTNEPQAVRLTVSDTGIGIPADQQERIFERFYRVDKSRSKEVGGTGLGLSIVKHAAKLHQATIDVQSVPDKGTEITVLFPKGNSNREGEILWKN